MVAIVGGGVIGTASAWQLATRLGRGYQVVLFEADAVACGSSSRAVGEVETQYLQRSDIEPRVRSMAMLADLEARVGLGIHRNGYLRLARSHDGMPALHASVDHQRACGVTSARVVGPDEIAGLVPGINLDRVTGGLLGPDDGHVDPYQLTHVYADLARAAGAVIREHTPVDAIQMGERGVESIRLVDGERVAAELVVNAAGSWAGRLSQTAGVHLPVCGYRHQVAVFQVASDYPDIPFTMDFLPGAPEPGVYLRKEGATRLVAGLHDDHLDPSTEVDPDGCPPGVDTTFVDTVVDRLAALLPALVDQLAFVDGWSGLYPFTESARPEVREVDDSGYLVAVGFGGVGIQLSPWAGEEVARLAAGAIRRRSLADLPE